MDMAQLVREHGARTLHEEAMRQPTAEKFEAMLARIEKLEKRVEELEKEG